MSKVEYVELTLKTGVVHIQNHDGSEIHASYSLWDGIIAKEFYPAVTEGGAYYVITLRKGVTLVADVSAAEAELSKALHKIASAWVFSGGSHMAVEHRDIISSAGSTSNAESVRERLLAAVGQREVSISYSMPMSIGATYSQAPLAPAVDIARIMQDDFFVNRLLGYYQGATGAYAGTAIWAVELYKVLDLIKKKYGKPHRAISSLTIADSDWSRFETLLNTRDLRHAEISNTAPKLSAAEIDWLLRMARSIVAKYLRVRGVAAIG
jgi:hypothetical protein